MATAACTIRQTLEEATHEHITASLCADGWCISPDFFPDENIQALRSKAMERFDAGDFRPAGIGRGGDYGVDGAVRSDWIGWIDTADSIPVIREYLAALDRLRLSINRNLYLGLFDLESHFAVYPAGSFYRKHLDRFQGVGLRTVTCILYLNDSWQEDDGGQLRLYTDPAQPRSYRDILPLGGQFVCFLSARFPHEVLPSRRRRISLTGWFRVRSNSLF